MQEYCKQTNKKCFSELIVVLSIQLRCFILTQDGVLVLKTLIWENDNSGISDPCPGWCQAHTGHTIAKIN